MGHAVPSAAPAALSLEDAGHIAETVGILAAPSRVRLLDRLRDSPASVNELAAAVEMSPSAVSHQLRVLRNLRLVTAQRNGKSKIYTLHDSHIAALLTEAIGHNEHLKLAPSPGGGLGSAS
jgi:DNA-binding transcriptional ArsR family regulator